MSQHVTIDIEARFVDNVSGEAKSAADAVDKVGTSADEAKKPLDTLGKTKVKPRIDVDDNKYLKKIRAAEDKARKLGNTKTAMVLSAIDKASTVVSRIVNKARSIAGKTWQAYAKVRDSEALASLRKIGDLGRGIAGKTWRAVVKVTDYATTPLRKLKDMLFSIQTLVAGIMAGFAANKLIVQPVGLADAYSSAQIGFSTLLGESRGQQMMDDLDVFAKKTPFKSSEVIGQTQRMLAMGWNAEDIIKDMETIGDAAAATGKGSMGMQQIVTALSQIKTKGRLSTEELNQLAEAGISAKKYLAEGLGYGTGDEGIAAMTKDLEDGAIASGKALNALLAGMKEYQGMMDKTANETVAGLWSQIQDTFEINIFRRWGQGLQEGAKKSFGSVVKLLDEADGALEKFGDTVFEVGKNISNWLADKFEKAVERITNITGSFEFKEADLGKKLSMLWNGVIVDPLKEWWDGGGQEKTAETAGNIGRWMGEFITNGLLAIFGATEVLADGEGAANAGKSVAGSFVKGFLDAFDGSAITDALVKAISNVWDALPWWGKMLVGGYGVAKGVGLFNSVVGGITSLIGNIGVITGSAGAGTGLLGYGANTAISMGAGNLAGGASLGAGTLSALGLGATAGGIAGGVTVIKGGYDLYGAYKSYQAGDETEGRAKVASGGGALAGVGTGAAIGAMFGGPIGALIGAGIGGVAGWWAGDKAADSIRSANYESQEMKEALEDSSKSAEDVAQTFKKAKWENMKKHFGDIELSLSECERLADQIVWGDDMGSFEKFSSSVKNAEANLGALKSAAESTEKWMWKAGLGVKFNDKEIESIKKSFDDYISSSKSYLENKHYEFTASADLLLDLETKEGKAILEGGNAFYKAEQEKLEQYGKELGDELSKALENGIIDADEEKIILAAQEKIANITKKISQAEAEAEIELIKVKFGGGNLDLDSFETFMATMKTTLNERKLTAEEAFTVQVANLKLRFPKGGKQYEQELKTLVAGYKAEIESVKVDILNVELGIIGEAYANELGDNAKGKLQDALNKAIEEGIDFDNEKVWNADKVRDLLGMDSLSKEAAGAIADMLAGVADQLELTTVNGKLILDLTTEEGTEEKVKEKVDKEIPDKVEKKLKVDITAEKRIKNQIDILAEEFNIPESKAASILWQLSSAKTIQNKVEILAKEFGINEFESKTIIWKLFGQKNILNTLRFSASEFGLKNSYSFSPTINVNPVKGTVTPIRFSSNGLATQEFRGGIVGGSSSYEAFARGGIAGYSDGGMVRGGARLIKVAEEGTPEMIIPLSSQRRDRGIKLWEKAGEMLGVAGFFRGGRTDNGNEEAHLNQFSVKPVSVGNDVKINLGGIQVSISVDAKGSANVVEDIKAKSHEIAEIIAGEFADALGGQFENTPLRGGA